MIPYSINRAGPYWTEHDPAASYEGYEGDSGSPLFKFAAIGTVAGAGYFAWSRPEQFRSMGASGFQRLRAFEDSTTLNRMTLGSFRLSSIFSPLIGQEEAAAYSPVPASSLAKRGVGWIKPTSLNISGAVANAPSLSALASIAKNSRADIELGSEFFGQHTSEYLSKITGMSVGEVNMKLGTGGLFWRRQGDRFLGDLIVKGADGEQLFARNTGLVFSEEGVGASTRLNRFAQAYVSLFDEDIAAKMGERYVHKAQTLDSALDIVYGTQEAKSSAAMTKHGLKFVPIGPGKLGGFLADVFKGTKIEGSAPGIATALHYGRAIPAWGSARMNDLIGQLTGPFPSVQKALTIKEGSFLKNQFRYAGKAALVYGSWQLLQNVDWLKRRDTIVTDTVTTGAYGLGAGLLAKKLFSASGKTSLIAGAAGALASITPPFEDGAVPGLATVATRLNLFRARITNAPVISMLPMVGSDYKRLLEDSMPGVTEPTTAAFVGLAIGAALSARHGSRIQEFKYQMEQRGGSVLPWKYEPRLGPSGPSNVVPPTTWTEAADQSWRISKRFLGDEYNSLSPARQARVRLDKEYAKEVFETKGFFSRFVKQARGAILHGTSDQMTEAIGLLGAKARPLGLVSNTLLRFGLPAIGFYALAGGLATSETPDELKDLYEGREYVPVKAGRWWEGGGTPYEGTRIKSWKPHWYRSLTTRTKQKALWGENEDDQNPLSKLFREEFTYDLEQRNYFSRPYPVTDQAFSDVPFLGWILSSTVGRLIKPARLMHAESLQSNGQFADMRSSIESNPVESLGGMSAQAPIGSASTRALFGEATREWMDQAGLVGWMGSLGMKQFTGDDSLFATDRWMESAGRMNSLERDFWEAEIGGGLFMSEPIRRFLPQHRREIDLYNPIPNASASWIPAHLRFGDPMSKTNQGELLFPGEGYAALYPELKGVDPEQYPMLHRYNILANVASWSTEFRRTANAVETISAEGGFGADDLDFINRINRRLRLSAERREFMTDINEETQLGLVGTLLGSAYRNVISGVKTVAGPFEYLVPFGLRPASKLLPQGTAIEEYEQNMVYGTELSFWDKPWRDWFRPALYTAAHNLGWDGMPAWRQDSREMLEYFDKLEYQKWDMLAHRASASGDSGNASQYAGMKQQTLFGVDPYADLRTVMKTIPYEEKDYFMHFVKERDPGDRDRILQMVPSTMQHIYIAQWEKLDLIDSENDKVLGHIMAQKNASEQQRRAELNQYFSNNPLPRPDWIGFNPNVDLEDVKMKIVQQGGGDIHDYGLWDSRERMMARKPYIDDSVTDGLFNDDPIAVRQKVYNALKSFGLRESDISVTQHLGSSARNDVKINYQDSRENEIRKIFGGF